MLLTIRLKIPELPKMAKPGQESGASLQECRHGLNTYHMIMGVQRVKNMRRREIFVPVEELRKTSWRMWHLRRVLKREWDF